MKFGGSFLQISFFSHFEDVGKFFRSFHKTVGIILLKNLSTFLKEFLKDFKEILTKF